MVHGIKGAKALILLLTLAGCQATPKQEKDWTTAYERSKGTVTPRYLETVDYCKRLAGESPWIAYATFGTSPQGRDLPLLIVDRNGNFTPEAVRASGNVVVLVEACIHAGECCGKDAGLMLVRDLTVAGKHPELLDHVTLLFIPIFNVDGHERFGPYNRANQNGPEQMGWRTTAQNLNLNRDFLKADTPEMRAWLTLFTTWLPDFFVDIHSTDGADFQYPITYSMEIYGNMDGGLTTWTENYLDGMHKTMAAAGYPISTYVSFRSWHDPRSGLRSGAAGPRFSQGYAAVQNRPGLLIEAHMLKDYPTRVKGTYAMLMQTLEVLNREHKILHDLVRAADRRTASPAFRKQPFALTFKNTEQHREIDFLGVEYEVVKSDLTGGDWVRYSDRPATLKIPWYNDVVPDETMRLPEAYLIPPEWYEVIRCLALHGVTMGSLREPLTVPVRSCRFENIRWEAERPWHALPYEGRHLCRFDIKPVVEERVFPQGTVVVDMDQRAARVAAHLLEPSGPDALVHWGFFNTVFQRVEYVETYVMEKMARDMLAKDHALADAFAKKKEENPDFAKNPRAILDWFYRQSPYYDETAFRYPVGMIDDRNLAEVLPLVRE